MRLLVNGATKTMRRLLPNEHLGVLLSPGCGNRANWWPKGTPWAVDNGAFTGFDKRKWLALLDRLTPDADCRFVVAPDKVGDARATRTLFYEWAPFIRDRGFPVAFVLQDGQDIDSVPWDECEAIFVGGSTHFKESRQAVALMNVAKLHGKWVHMGRVNTLRRIKFAVSCGCDSADGSAFSWYSDTYLPKFLSLLNWLTSQQQTMRYA